MAALAALALYIALPFINPPAETPQPRLVASLAADGSDVRYLAVYDARARTSACRMSPGERAAGRDFELWMIEGQQAAGVAGRHPCRRSTSIWRSATTSGDKIASGAVLAISLEPAGGSPTGQPTGPVVAAGDLKSI